MPDHDATRLQQALACGDDSDESALFLMVYPELRALAQSYLARETPGQTLQATALVHEVWLRLGGADANWKSRGHFFRAAAESMRWIMIDQARTRKSKKRGGDRQRLSLDQISLDLLRFPIDEHPEWILDLDDALTALAEEDPVKAELVKLRFFAGLSLEHAASALGISRALASQHWRYARAWLQHRLS